MDQFWECHGRNAVTQSLGARLLLKVLTQARVHHKGVPSEKAN